MKITVIATSLIVLASLILGACSASQVQTAQTDLQSAAVVVNATACNAQALANKAVAVAQVAGDAKAVADAQLISGISGTLCLTLAPVVALAPAAK
jgi:hypothetical protein